MDSPTRLIVKLSVDVVPSRGGHSQFSALALHAANQVAVRGADRPVLYHWKKFQTDVLFKKKSQTLVPLYLISYLKLKRLSVRINARPFTKVTYFEIRIIYATNVAEGL